MLTNLSSQLTNESSGIFFRNGFVVADAGQALMLRDGWTSNILGSVQLAKHPDTPLVSGTASGIRIAIIGHAFDPERALYSETDVLAGLLSDIQREESFYAAIDRLAGRFAIVVDSTSGTQIYQDAMGSRSVFYSVSGPAVAASHAELVREVIGTNFADFFVPFITSKNYIQRDVKYLPGVATAYDDVVQLTPNTKLSLQEQRSERFWPRAAPEGPMENQDAADVLVGHMQGMAAYLKYRSFRPVIGLTAGTDSRGVLAAVKDLNPYIFTYVRSDTGTAVNSKDARIARELAHQYDLQANVWPIPNLLNLNKADDEFGRAYRLATGYHRGSGAPWLKILAEVSQKEVAQGMFVRGFGGEVMRGFYQGSNRRIRKATLNQLADAYDVNSGSGITRRLFADMIERTDFTAATTLGYDPNDIFYWEHRMGTWGSLSLTEADLAMPSMVGYNSRNLFSAFMRLSESDRTSRLAFDMATAAMAPKLASIS